MPKDCTEYEQPENYLPTSIHELGQLLSAATWAGFGP